MTKVLRNQVPRKNKKNVQTRDQTQFALLSKVMSSKQGGLRIDVDGEEDCADVVGAIHPILVINFALFPFPMKTP